MKFDIGKEVILVSGEKEVAVVVYGSEFDFCFGSLYSVAADLIVAMNDGIANSPNIMPFVPDAA